MFKIELALLRKRFGKEGVALETSVTISTQTITLGQLLKEVSLIDTGGMAKWFLSEYEVYLNGQLENRRGKKLYNGDIISIPAHGAYRIVALG